MQYILRQFLNQLIMAMIQRIIIKLMKDLDQMKILKNYVISYTQIKLKLY